jgi:hypothetical protein
MRRILRDNGLTLVLMTVFLATWVGQFFSGRLEYNDTRREHGLPPVSMGSYLWSGHFWQATAENWESEFLQMAMFVMLTCCLHQKGSPESKDPDEPSPVDEDPRLAQDNPDAPWPVRRGGWALRLYSHSLSICFIALFLLSVAIHVAAGVRIHNEERIAHGVPPESAMNYFASSQFWFEAMQNWQSEFLSLAAMVYLSVYLRQRGSAESKPVASPHFDHGEESPTGRPSAA